MVKQKCNKDNEDSVPTSFSVYSLNLSSNSVLREEWEKMPTVKVWGEESFISAEGLMKLSVKGLGRKALVGLGGNESFM